VENSLSHDHTKAQLLMIDLGSFLELFAWFLKHGGRRLVSKVVPSFRFDLSQVSRSFLVIFQVYKGGLVVLVLILV